MGLTWLSTTDTQKDMKIQSNRRTGDELDVRIYRCSGSSRNFAKYNSVCFTDQERLYYDLINQFRWTQDGLWYWEAPAAHCLPTITRDVTSQEKL